VGAKKNLAPGRHGRSVDFLTQRIHRNQLETWCCANDKRIAALIRFVQPVAHQQRRTPSSVNVVPSGDWRRTPPTFLARVLVDRDQELAFDRIGSLAVAW
jgi:hypothetical protein